MHQFLQQIFSGLAAGSIYASLALALVMIYRATDLVNFADCRSGLPFRSRSRRRFSAA
jgi:branched-subunit amino acid ABC-type transport system permease component